MAIDSLSPDQIPVALSEVKGVFCSDVIIRHALMAGLQDLRDNPWQLPLVFASFLDDPYTTSIYGEKLVAKIVNWFLKTNIPVVMDYNLPSDQPMPCITIGLQESNEAEATIGDVHYVSSESSEAVWEPVGQKFNASYNPDTGLVTPFGEVVVNDQMILVDGVGASHPVLSVQVDTNGNDTFFIESGLVANFNKCVLKWSTSKLSVNLESCNFKEIYTIGCHVKGDPSYVLYLWSIVVYCLMRYKKTLIEGRGFERTTIASTRVMPNVVAPVGTEACFSRFITITGYCKMYWATQFAEKITKATFGSALTADGSKVSPAGYLPGTFSYADDQEDPVWLEGDGIGVPID
jgi:hypothetical protein